MDNSQTETEGMHGSELYKGSNYKSSGKKLSIISLKIWSRRMLDEPKCDWKSIE